MTNLQSIRQACEAASKGPWKIYTDTDLYLSMAPLDLYIDHGSPKITEQDRDNLKFIALARTAVPALCDALEMTTKIIKQLADTNEEANIFLETTKLLREVPARIAKIIDGSE